MAKFETSSSVGMLAIVEDRDGVDVGIEDGPHASRCDGDGLTSVRGGDGVGATSKDLTGIDTVDMDGVDDARLSLGGFEATTEKKRRHLPLATMRTPELNLLQSSSSSRLLSSPTRKRRCNHGSTMLYQFDKDENQWKERGADTMKFLKHKASSKVRLLMRQSKTLKIYANHLILPMMSVQEQAGNEKSRAMDRFHENENGILVATDVAARGLDILGVRIVVHYQLPHSAEDKKNWFDRNASSLELVTENYDSEEAQVNKHKQMKTISRQLKKLQKVR
ncbi:hypothetical protein JHK87_016032 [Glycine soja]|nr:hypothetical protein JHK87_016032 [Glycine soja]